MTALAAIDDTARFEPEVPASVEFVTVSDPLVEPVLQTVAHDSVGDAAGEAWPVGTRWFNGRPVRPAKTLMMKVTAYSPDHRSCGHFADGKTASLHSVETNNMKLVAADSRILPLGSMITVPGYDSDAIVPVLDRGGAIKGHRLDVLFPTHRVARKWGVRTLPVTVWEYADGLPACDFRGIRDSRN